MIMRNAVILVGGAGRNGRGLAPECRARSGRASEPSGGADRGGHRARDDSAHAKCVLGSMAIAIMGGLTVATVLTIFLCPFFTRRGSGSAGRRRFSLGRAGTGGMRRPKPRW